MGSIVSGWEDGCGRRLDGFGVERGMDGGCMNFSISMRGGFGGGFNMERVEDFPKWRSGSGYVGWMKLLPRAT